MPATVDRVAGWLEEVYPTTTAEEWDRVGLVVGDPIAPVTRVLLTVDVTDDVISEARSRGAHLVVAHHPLLLRGVHAIRRDQPKGRMVLALIESGIALYAAHTNADACPEGVSDALAAALNLTAIRPLQPSVHPSAPAGSGIGRIGTLPAPVSVRTLAHMLAQRLPATATGVRVGGDPDRQIRTVALVAGAGDSLLEEARLSGADLYITSDLRHHPAREFLDHAGAPALLDIPHWAAESLWLEQAARLLQSRAHGVGVDLEVAVSTLSTDPWTLRV